MAKSHKISKPSTMKVPTSKWNRPTKRTPIVLLIGAKKVNTTKDNYSLDWAVSIFRLEKSSSLINKFSWKPKIKQESQRIKNQGFRFRTVIKFCKQIMKLAKNKNVHFWKASDLSGTLTIIKFDLLPKFQLFSKPKISSNIKNPKKEVSLKKLP